MFKDFRVFVNQGNAMDLAVGVVIGAAFGKIVVGKAHSGPDHCLWQAAIVVSQPGFEPWPVGAADLAVQ